jgi:lysophospholipase L1-like esterase
MNKVMVVLVSTLLAVLSGCAQSVGSDSAVVPVLAHPVTDTEKPNLCLIGDSRVAMFPVELFTEYDVYDYGVGGSDSGDNVEILSAIADTGVQFDAIIVSVGVNDWSSRITNRESVANIRECLAIANTLSSRVFVTTIPGCCPNSDKPMDKVIAISANAAAINAHIPAIAETGNNEIIPVAEALSGDDGYIKAEYNLDGIHYNAAGYAVIYDLYMQYLK